jgi:LuxR family transcriptional regulator, quorum-sensing system regulator SolR
MPHMETAWTLKMLCDAFEGMEGARTSDDLRVQMEKFAKQMGFDHFVYALTIDAPSLKQQQYILNGFPQQWFDRYVEAGYFKVDPVVRYAQNSSLPAIWTDQIFHDGKSAEFWEEARAYGLQCGLSFAVHEQPGVTGIFSLARDQPLDLNAADMAALIGRAQLFASMLHHAVARIDLPKLVPEQNVSLTPRERECLRWSADGKTAWEIGKILNIAERTVVFHVNNVIQKLGAANKTQAIVRAVALKLV